MYLWVGSMGQRGDVEKQDRNGKRERAWCLTVQKPNKKELAWWQNVNEKHFSWLVCALEHGKKGVPHLQVALRLKHGKTWSAAFDFFQLKKGDDLSNMIAESRAGHYCLKGEQSKEEWESQNVDGPNYGLNVNVIRQIGNLPKNGTTKKSAWDDIASMVEDGCSDMEILRKFPSQFTKYQTAIQKLRLLFDYEKQDWRDVTVTYIHGETGTGKTRHVMEQYGYKNVHRVTNYNSGAFDGYRDQDVVVFEEFRSSFKLQDMLNFLDGYPVELPCRYANKYAKFTKVYILTNLRLDEQYENQQENYPLSYDAFLRRIDNVIELTKPSLE